MYTQNMPSSIVLIFTIMVCITTFGSAQLSVSSYCDGITQYLDDQGPKTGDIVDVSVGSVNRALVYPFFLDVAIPTSQVSVVSVSYADACAASGKSTDCQDPSPTPATTQRTIWMQSSTFVAATVLNTLRSAIPISISSFMSISLGAVSSAQQATFPTAPSTPSYLEQAILPLASLGAATANTTLLESSSTTTTGVDRVQWAVTADTATMAADQLQGNAVPYGSQYLAAMRGIRSSLAAGNVTVVGLQGRCDTSKGGALASASSSAFTSTTPFQFIRGCSVAAVVQGIDDQYIYLESVVGQDDSTSTSPSKANAIAVLGYMPLQEFFTRWVICVPVAAVVNGGAAASVWSYSTCTNCILSIRPSSVADALTPPKRTASKPLSKYVRL